MNCAQVRIQMESYRTGGEDTLSPAFGEMQQHLGACSACRQRMERIQAIDQSIGRVMRDVSAPEGLKDAILGGFASHRQVRSPRRFPAWATGRMSLVLAAAAVLAVVFIGRSLLSPAPEARLLDLFIQDSRTHAHLDVEVTDEEAALAWFHEQQGMDVVLPAAMKNDVPLVGCRKVVVDGEPVAFLCLEKGSRILSLYVFEQGSLDPDAFPQERSWQVSRGGWVARGWSENDMTYVVALPGEARDLEEFLTVI